MFKKNVYFVSVVAYWLMLSGQDRQSLPNIMGPKWVISSAVWLISVGVSGTSSQLRSETSQASNTVWNLYKVPAAVQKAATLSYWHRIVQDGHRLLPPEFNGVFQWGISACSLRILPLQCVQRELHSSFRMADIWAADEVIGGCFFSMCPAATQLCELRPSI